MKKAIYAIVLTALAVILLCSFAVSADGFDKTDSIYEYGISDEEIREIIGEAYDRKTIDLIYSSEPTYKPESIYIDPEIFAVEYAVTVESLKQLQSGKSDNPKDALSKTRPVIYIPIFLTEQSDSRVVGHAKLYYSYAEGKYIQNLTFLNPYGNEEHFLDRTCTPERLNGLFSELDLQKPEKVVFASLAFAVNDTSNKLLLIQSDDGWMVYDPQNTANAKDTEKVLYDKDSYIAQRISYENSRASSVPAYGGNGAGTYNSDSGFTMNGTLIVLLIMIPLVSISAAVAAIVILYRRKRAKRTAV